jgi:anti-sigma B factor antagonist
MTWLSSSSDSSSDPPARADPPARGSAGPPGAQVVIEVDVRREAATMVVTGELDLTTRAVLAEQLSAILRTRPRRLILDLAGTGFIDCGTARLIVSAGQSLSEGTRTVIRRPSRAVRRVLELTGLDASCEIEG